MKFPDLNNPGLKNNLPFPIQFNDAMLTMLLFFNHREKTLCYSPNLNKDSNVVIITAGIMKLKSAFKQLHSYILINSNVPSPYGFLHIVSVSLKVG